MKNCTSSEAPDKENSDVCPYSNADLQDENAEGIGASEIKTTEYPMRWHKCLLVLLIIGAVINALIGIAFIAGGKVLTIRGLVDVGVYYSTYPGLENYYRFSAVINIAIGVFQVIVWKRLKEYRANGLISLKILYVLGILLNIINLSWASSAMNTNLFSAKNCWVIIGWVVMLIINSSYYAKRSELFIN